MPTPPPLPADGFLNALARVSLVLAIAGLAWALLQMVLALLLPDAAVARLAAFGQVPAPVVRVLELRHPLALATLLLAVVFLATAWGLLKRREWARLAFIVLLVAGALANFAGLALIDPLFAGLEGMFPARMLDTPDGRQFAAQVQAHRLVAWSTGVLGALAFAALHGWLVWKLCSAPVRARFGRREA